MSFGSFKHYFMNYFEKANEYGLGWLFVVLIVGLLVWYLSKGNKLSFRVPFLPRFMNKVTLDPAQLAKLKDKGEGLLKEKDQQNADAKDSDAANASGLSASNIKHVAAQHLKETAEQKADIEKNSSSLGSMLLGADKKRYQQPTYLVLSHGESNHNKGLLKDLASQLGNKVNAIKQGYGTRYDNWFHYDSGTLVLAENTALAISQAQQYRPERPLDGVIVTVSIKQLLDTHHPDELKAWANQIFSQIWLTQKRTGFILPIYMLLTEAETLASFKEFWEQEQLEKHLNGPFGWVNNHSNTVFQPVWIHEVMDNLSNYLRNIQIAIMTDEQSSYEKNNTHALLFPKAFGSIEHNLTVLCRELFHQSIFQSSLMLRGIHITGTKLASEQHRLAHHLFIEQWLEQNVYPEAGLAYAPRNRFISSNRKLRRYQHITLALFALFFVFLTKDALDLRHQTHNLTSHIEDFPKSPVSGPAQLDYIGTVVDHVAQMDAHSINYISMPFSWNTPFNDKLVTYFDVKVFDSILFPAMKCQMNALLAEKLGATQLLTHHSNSSTPTGGTQIDREKRHFKEWLLALSENVTQRKALNDYILEPQEKGDVIAQFGEYFQYLWQKQLPNSFFSNTDLYRKAIANQTQNLAYLCSPVTQAEIKTAVDHHIEGEINNIASQVEAPHTFFALHSTIQSLPSSANWGYSAPSFPKELFQFSEWLKGMNNFWMQDHPLTNECRIIESGLTELKNSGIDMATKNVAGFFQQCINRVTNVVRDDEAITPFTLYEKTDYPFTFTAQTQKRFESIKNLNQLSFMSQPLSSTPQPMTGAFYWSTDALNFALELEEEYEVFALKQYKRLLLPAKAELANTETDFAQSIALKQLQKAMLHHIMRAQSANPIDYHPAHLTPINQIEADLAASVENFETSMDSIMSLLLTFKKLGFTESYNWFRDVTQKQAYRLLQQVDKVYRDSRIYRPLNSPRWSAHEYNDVLFGIGGEGQLLDYLDAQDERVNEIAQNYAEPLIVFLLNTQGKYIDYDLFGKWHNTLVELNKQQNKNPANSLDNLKGFMQGQLASVNQSNCFKKVKDLANTQANDVFAIQQREIRADAVAHCESFRADKIKGEYAEVKSLFNRYLAGKSPFSQMPDAPSVSPKSMRAFVEGYLPIANGLFDRMEVLAWKDGRNNDAKQFIKNMNTLSNFFASVLIAPKGQTAPGIELQLDFNVMKQHAQYVRHLTQWQWQVGHESVDFPGSEKALVWMPKDKIALQLHWADQSPFVPVQRLPYESSGPHQNDYRVNQSNAYTLQYANEHLWSLVHFVQQHHSTLPDSESLSDESALLEFEAMVRNKDATSPKQQQVMKAFARLNAYGLETLIEEDDDKNPLFVAGNKVAIAIPTYFPQSVPKVH